jgi:MATE family multidrug resistance protein
VVVTQMGYVGMGLVDTMVVGHLGAVPLAAVALGNSIFFALSLFVVGTLDAVTPMSAQAFGAGQHDRCGESVWAGLWVGGLLGLPLVWLFLDCRWLLELLRQDPAVIAETHAYLHARAWAVIPFCGFAAYRGLMNGTGDVRPVMVVTLLANGVNLLADWALVFGNLGLPEMGIAGAGWATTASRGFMWVALVALTARPRFARYGLWPRVPGWQTVKRLLVVGLPIGGHIVAEVGVFASVAVLMGWLGPTQQAAHQVAISLASFTFMIPLGVGVAASIEVGQAIGRDDYDGAARAQKLALMCGTGVMCVSALMFLLVPGLLAALFTEDAAVVASAVTLLRVAAAFQVVDGAQAVAGGCLRGAGDTRTPFYAHLLGHWGLGLPVGAFLAFKTPLGGRGLWLGLTVGLTFVAVWLVRRILGGAWRERGKLVDEPSPAGG